MITLFRYNWQVRDEWFEWCKQVSEDELIKERVGGVKSILRTLYHIVIIEADWLLDLQGKPEPPNDFALYNELNAIVQLSKKYRPEIQSFIEGLTPETEAKVFAGVRNGQPHSFLYGEVLRHVIAHEIHHIGQMSVWARELGLPPVSANLIRRGLYQEPRS